MVNNFRMQNMPEFGQDDQSQIENSQIDADQTQIELNQPKINPNSSFLKENQESDSDSSESDSDAQIKVHNYLADSKLQFEDTVKQIQSATETEKEQSAKSENQVMWRKLKELSRFHIKKVVQNLSETIDKNKWESVLYKLVLQAVEQVRPSSRYLKDSMDFNKYIFIQLIDYPDESKSTLVNGCVFMKNLADKGMPKLIENPRILLLKGSLGFIRDVDDQQEQTTGGNKGGNIYIDISSVISQEDHFVNIVIEKVKLVRPDVIVTEKDISFKILKALKSMGVAAISNMHEDKMRRLARLTKTIIAPSANILDSNFPLGLCKLFRVEEPQVSGRSTGFFDLGGNRDFNEVSRIEKKAVSQQRTQIGQNMNINWNRMTNQAGLEQNKQIIFFEGCNQILGCTILLSGPFHQTSSKIQDESTLRQSRPQESVDLLNGYQKLLKVMWQLRKMLSISRNIILEREFLYSLRINPNVSDSTFDGVGKFLKIVSDNSDLIESQSPYLVTRTIKNRSSLVLYKVMIRKGPLSRRVQQYEEVVETNQKMKTGVKTVQNNPFFQSVGDILLNQTNSHQQESQAVNQSIQIQRKNLLGSAQNTGEGQKELGEKKLGKIDENFVKTKFDSMCGQPRKIKFQFFNVNLGYYELNIHQQQILFSFNVLNDPANQTDFDLGLMMEGFKNDDSHSSFKNFLDQKELHHFDKDETLGNFLVRLAQQSDKNRDSHLAHVHTLQRQIIEERNSNQSHSTYLVGASNNMDYLGLKQNLQGRLDIRGLTDEQGKIFERPLHNLHCGFKNCKDPLKRHVLSFYHKDGCLDIEVISCKKPGELKGSGEDGVSGYWEEQIKDQESLKFQQKQGKKKSVRNWDQIFFQSKCKKCGIVSQKREVMSDLLFEHSLARFIEQYFYNSNLTTICSHQALRDSFLIFYMADGSQISFNFTKLEVYSVDLLNLRQQNNNVEKVFELCIGLKGQVDYLVALKQKMSEKSLLTILDSLSRSLSAIQDFEQGRVENLHSKVLDELEMSHQEKQQLTQSLEGDHKIESGRKDSVLKSLKSCLLTVKDQIDKVSQLQSKLSKDSLEQSARIMKTLDKVRQGGLSYEEHHTPQDILKFSFLQRKFLINVFSIEQSFRQILKMLSILEVLVELRLQVLNSPNQHFNPSQFLERNEGLSKQLGTFLPYLPNLVLQRIKLSNKTKHKDLQLKQIENLNVEEWFQFENDIELINLQDNQPNIDSAFQLYFNRVKPPSISSEQMLSFLSSLYGDGSWNFQNERGQINKQNEGELKYLFSQGYRIVNEKVRVTLKQLNLQIELSKLNITHQEVIAIFTTSPKTSKTSRDWARFLKKHLENPKNEQFQEEVPFTTSLLLPLGSDNSFVNASPEDNGSIISFALSSNLYKEALIKSNYLDFQSRAKQLVQQQSEVISTTKGDQSYQGHSRQQRQTLNLVGKDDIFNIEQAPQFIETEMLCGEQQRLSFKLKFSCFKDESSIQIQKHLNSNFNEIKSDENSLLINTFKKCKQELQTPLRKSDQVSAFYKDLNLNNQILKEFPLGFLEAPTQQKLKQTLMKERSEGGDGKTNDQRQLNLFEIVLALQNNVYFQIQKVLFDTQQPEGGLNIQQFQSQRYNQSTRGTTQEIGNYRDQPQVHQKYLIGLGMGGPIALQQHPKQSRENLTSGLQSISGQSIREKDKQNKQIHSVQQPIAQNGKEDQLQTLFGIRRPIGIFFDHDFKHRVLQEEMIANQSIIYPPKAVLEAIAKDELNLHPESQEQDESASHSVDQSFETKHIKKSVFNYIPSKQADLHLQIQNSFQNSNQLERAIGVRPQVFEKTDFNVKIYYPKKFEVLRKFYCGSQLNFIQSMMSSKAWSDVSGGKTQSPFQKTFDQKYVMKEVRRSELKMFLEFAPQYFDYMCKAFFHDYPCTLAKIVGVFKIRITKTSEKVGQSSLTQNFELIPDINVGAGGQIDKQGSQGQGISGFGGIVDPDDEAEYYQSLTQLNRDKQQKLAVKTVKKYIFVCENLNFGIGEEDEKFIYRFDLKGSTLNRFVQEKEQRGEEQQQNRKGSPNESELESISATPNNILQPLGVGEDKQIGREGINRVYHDNNFIYEMGARPLPMRHSIHKVLNICVNNDTLCLSKSQIIDYSLLVIINTKTKTLRFGIIDYVQHYTLEKMLETRFKKILKRNEPTIIEPEKYKKRFKNAVRRYFIGMCVQNEKEKSTIEV